MESELSPDGSGPIVGSDMPKFATGRANAESWALSRPPRRMRLRRLIGQPSNASTLTQEV